MVRYSKSIFLLLLILSTVFIGGSSVRSKSTVLIFEHESDQSNRFPIKGESKTLVHEIKPDNNSRKVLNIHQDDTNESLSDMDPLIPSTQINISALRTFLSNAKLADGGFQIQPIRQGIPQSDTWATFLLAWTAEFIGLQDIVFFEYDRSPLDYFAQLTTPDSGLRNSTLSTTVTVFSTALGLILWDMYADDPTIPTDVLGNSTLTFIQEAQEPLGGFGETTRRADLFSTALCLQALELLNAESYNPFIPRNYVNSLYDDEFGYFSDPELKESSLWETWSGLWAAQILMPWKSYTQTASYIFQQQLNGSWGSLADNFVAVSSLALIDSLVLEENDPLLKYVRDCQYLNESSHLHGGFKSTPSASVETASSINTAYAMYILHVLGGIAEEVTYTFSTDQEYYVQGEPVSIYVEAYYGPESLDNINMSFAILHTDIEPQWSGYDTEYGAYWQQFDTFALFGPQTIRYTPYWEESFLTSRIQGEGLTGTFVVGYDIAIDVEPAIIEPGDNAVYTVTVSNTETAVQYPVDILMTGPSYHTNTQITTATNGTTLPFFTTPDMLLGEYMIQANFSISDTNLTRTAQAMIEVNTPIETEVEGLALRYMVGDPLELTVRSWYNSSEDFPMIPLTVVLDYHGVITWESEAIYGTGGEYAVNLSIPVEPILGEVMMTGSFQFPDFTYEVDLGRTTIEFALTVDQVQIPEVMSLARSFQASYTISSTHIPAENLTDFQSYMNLTALEPFQNHTFSRQITAEYQNDQFLVNWTVDPNLPATQYNLTIGFVNPFGETTPAYHTTIRLEEGLHFWIAADTFTENLAPGDPFQLDFVVYWTPRPGYVNLAGGAINDIQIVAQSTIPEHTKIPVAYQTIHVAGYTIPGYGIYFKLPEDMPGGLYPIEIRKQQTGELLTTIELSVTTPSIPQRYTWFRPFSLIMIVLIVGLSVGYRTWKWRKGRPLREAKWKEAKAMYMIEELKEELREINIQLQSIFRDPILDGWPRKFKPLQEWFQRFDTRPLTQQFIALERQYETQYPLFEHHLITIQEAVVVLIHVKEITPFIPLEHLDTLQSFNDRVNQRITGSMGDDTKTLKEVHIDRLQEFQDTPPFVLDAEEPLALNALVQVIRQFDIQSPTTAQEAVTHALQVITEDNVQNLLTRDAELHHLRWELTQRRNLEECTDEITYYLRIKELIVPIIRLFHRRTYCHQELRRLQTQIKDPVNVL